ncbi:MAG: hypothetical protein IJ240_03820, partial [Clostridia bacterium]|nr:hypothetical protein [Clostridia bacterium]
MAASVVKEMTDEEVAALTGSQTPAPMPTEVVTAQDAAGEDGLIERWGQVTKTQVKFRSSASRANNKNVIKTLNKNTNIWVDHIEEQNGVEWYAATVNGTSGYILTDCVNLFDEAKSLSYQASLNSPVPTHTPKPTRVPTATPTATPEPPTPTTPAPMTPTPIASATPPQ